jgi:hypothetical protein
VVSRAVVGVVSLVGWNLVSWELIQLKQRAGCESDHVGPRGLPQVKLVDDACRARVGPRGFPHLKLVDDVGRETGRVGPRGVPQLKLVDYAGCETTWGPSVVAGGRCRV